MYFKVSNCVLFAAFIYTYFSRKRILDSLNFSPICHPPSCFSIKSKDAVTTKASKFLYSAAQVSFGFTVVDFIEKGRYFFRVFISQLFQHINHINRSKKYSLNEWNYLLLAKALESGILRQFLGWRYCFQGHFREIDYSVQQWISHSD